MNKKKIFVAGHKGMVGSAIIRQLKHQEIEIITRDRNELDLLNQNSVQNFFIYLIKNFCISRIQCVV